MPINDWIVDGEQTKRITAIFRPRRGLEAKLLQAVDAAEKRNPCVGYLVVDVPSTFLETTKRRYFDPDELIMAESEGTARYGVANTFEYFVRIPLNEEGAKANLVEALKMEDKTVGIPFAPQLLENPERMGHYDAIKLTKNGAHFLTIRRYTEERPDVLEIVLVDPINKNNVFRRKNTQKTKITNSKIFKETIPLVNQYVNRIFRALDEKGLVKHD